jgi:5-(carboxyamino)imidazole ribonucleotide synthase
VHSAAELTAAIDEIKIPAILKSAAFGYDGKGQRLIEEPFDLDEIWRNRPGDELILERAVDFEKEVSVIVARGRQRHGYVSSLRKHASQPHPQT